MCVHLAARICGLAGPGEVLVSRTVKDLVVGSGIELSEHGVHALRGVPGEWELFSVA
jgi:class 3 adenylate cyclase